jgi:hypothetical protein
MVPDDGVSTVESLGLWTFDHNVPFPLGAALVSRSRKTNKFETNQLDALRPATVHLARLRSAPEVTPHQAARTDLMMRCALSLLFRSGPLGTGTLPHP